jgi:hypothetical protein
MTFDVRARLSGELEGSYLSLHNAVAYARHLVAEFGEPFEVWSTDNGVYSLVETIQPRRYTSCHCCGASFYTDKPQDPERDTGFGTCEECYPMVSASWVKHGFPGERPITIEDAYARLKRYA